MNTKEHSQEYFSARGVSEELYIDVPLPAYFKEVLDGLEANARILDFGCGFGQTLNAIQSLNTKKSQSYKSSKNNENSAMGGGAETNQSNPTQKIDSGYYLCGIDINMRAIEYVKSLGIDALCIEDILSFKPKEKFDLIITTHCLEHLPKQNIISTLQHFREHILKKNGKIFVAVPNAQSATGCYWAYEDFTHNTLFTAGSLIYVLKMAGFSDVKIIDKDALAGSRGIKKFIKKALLSLYILKTKIWNKATNSAFHAPSPQVFSYEVKAIAFA